MFSGPPLPLLTDLPLCRLFDYTRPPELLGAWLRGCKNTVRISEAGSAGRRRVLISSDLGFLLSQCSQIALREGTELVVLRAELIIHWRALQVVTAAPYLPGLERLSAVLPGLRSNHNGFQVPIAVRSPEEVLAECLANGLQVSGSRVVYCIPPDSGPGN